MAKADLADTYWSVLLPLVLSPYGVYLARIYAAAAVPSDVVEAGRMDGASEWRIFTRIALPMMVPGLVTVFLFQFVAVWNNFLLPYIMLSDDEKFPITLGPLHAPRTGRQHSGALHPGDHGCAARGGPADRALPGHPAVLEPRSAVRSRKVMTMSSTGGRRKPPTIHDVAREAGVSRGTVSRVLNGGHYVSPTAAGGGQRRRSAGRVTSSTGTPAR